MKLKEVNYELSRYNFDFERPKAHLEQYPTPFTLASSCLFEIDSAFDEIEGKSVADFGCGTGVFSIGAKIFGASEVFAFDIDQEVIEQAKLNVEEFEEENETEGCLDFIQADVLSLDSLLRRSFDIVLMNPPFGTNDKNVGRDMAFVRKGLALVVDNSGPVYSFHKSACRQFILKECAATGIKAKIVAEVSFPIKKIYKFHRKNNVDVAVDFIRFTSSSQ